MKRSIIQTAFSPGGFSREREKGGGGVPNMQRCRDVVLGGLLHDAPVPGDVAVGSGRYGAWLPDYREVRALEEPLEQGSALGGYVLWCPRGLARESVALALEER
jgi:hypothetical protein